jgi:CheY-like chemotaxis protein
MVVLVDDDDVNRRGMAALLAECGRIQVLAALSHVQAMAWDHPWTRVDIALVDVADERAEEDHFPGVAVIEQIDRRRSRSRTTIVVITGHFFDDAVRRRVREAGADLFFHRSELADVRALYGLVLSPDTHRVVPGPLDPEAQFEHGVTDVARVNRAVTWAVDHGLEALLAERLRPRSRSWLRLRREFNREARLHPVTIDGRCPDRVEQLPSLPQIARFLAWATRVKTTRLPRREAPSSRRVDDFCG